MAENRIEQIKVSVENFATCLCTIYDNGKARVILVDSVDVKAHYRRQGYGTKLMQNVISLAHEKNVDAIELVVNRHNLSAQGLYEKVGFEITDKIHYRMILKPWMT